MFVDATGRRRRRVRRVAYAVGAACLTYTCLVAASVIGHPARPAALDSLPAPADRPLPAIRQTQPPRPPVIGVPLPPPLERPAFSAAPMRLQRHEPERRARPRPATAPQPVQTESAPLPTPTAEQPAPTEPPAPSDTPKPSDPPEPQPNDPQAPEPGGQPDPVPTPEPQQQGPLTGLPVVGPILGLL